MTFVHHSYIIHSFANLILILIVILDLLHIASTTAFEKQSLTTAIAN